MNPSRFPKDWGIRLAKLWRDFGGNPYPIDVRKFAIEYSRQTSPDAPIGAIEEVSGIDRFEGGLFWLPNKRHWVILYRVVPGLDGRGNFTLAHELGHFVLHRQQQQEFRCSAENVLGQGRSAGQNIELEADTFASYLLLPADEFRSSISGKPIDIDLLSECANRYRVSLTAAALKWIELTDVSAALVVARDGFIKWYRPSTSARPFAHRCFAPGTELPAASHAASGYEFLSDQQRRQGANCASGIWASHLGCREMGVVLDKYDLTITLLVFDRPVEPSDKKWGSTEAERDESE